MEMFFNYFLSGPNPVKGTCKLLSTVSSSISFKMALKLIFNLLYLNCNLTSVILLKKNNFLFFLLLNDSLLVSTKKDFISLNFKTEIRCH